MKVHGFHYNLDPNEAIQADMSKGSYEPVQSGWLSEILEPGCLFVDVGASFGWHTALAAKIMGNTGCVLAFASLSRFVADNRLINVDVFNKAVGDLNGHADLLLPPDTDALYSPSVFESGEGFRRHRVPLITLDSLGITEPVDLIKIDVEGYEPNVLRGMARLGKSGLVKHLICEFNSGWLRRNAAYTPAQLFEDICHLGFRPIARTEQTVGLERDGTTPFTLEDILFSMQLKV